jgi:hypothetical protein
MRACLRRRLRARRAVALPRTLGAGRKPKGEFAGKSATITTRIRPDTRGQRAHMHRGRRRLAALTA